MKNELTPLGRLVVTKKEWYGESWKDYAMRFGCSVRTLQRALCNPCLPPWKTGGWEYVLGITFEQKLELMREQRRQSEEKITENEQ